MKSSIYLSIPILYELVRLVEDLNREDSVDAMVSGVLSYYFPNRRYLFTHDILYSLENYTEPSSKYIPGEGPTPRRTEGKTSSASPNLAAMH